MGGKMEDKYKEFWKKMADSFREVWGADIIQMAVYNCNFSHTGNLVVVLKNDAIENIVKAHSITKSIRRKGVEPPLVISPEYIANSLDSFPLEFMNIKTDYYNIKSEKDVFSDLVFEKKYIRLQAERELKSKILLIKMAVFDYYSDAKMLRELIKTSVQSIEPVLKGILFLLDKEIPLGHEELFLKTDEATSFDIDSLLTAVHFTMSKIKLSKEELMDFFNKYTSQLQALSDFVEQMQIG
jgi:hypothetical protein